MSDAFRELSGQPTVHDLDILGTDRVRGTALVHGREMLCAGESMDRQLPGVGDIGLPDADALGHRYPFILTVEHEYRAGDAPNGFSRVEIHVGPARVIGDDARN